MDDSTTLASAGNRLALLTAVSSVRSEMTPERWQLVKAILAQALEYSQDDARSSFLQTACGDDTALRREVQSLLDQPSHDEFEVCAESVGLTRPAAVQDPNTGRRVGAYELVRELGHGGMGTVWLARRADQQFEKLVAIKLLKRGTDTEEVLRRFESERRLLAHLQHPNIAGLFDGGTTEDSLPYFVMEYVPGVSVTTFCVERQLSIDERLRLFLKICAAVQFAHQHLIVHRDLKPANILVTDEGEPKLLDFGIAKLLAHDENAFQVTMVDHQRLTPAYASPEQVRGDSITTVSDIYGLGALLYELLTGKSAHRFSTTRPAPTELLRVVAHEEPLRPSAAATDLAVRRRLSGDLDNIVLKALRKEPERRYGGMGSFAEDIRRHLENLPVLARKDTVGYRAGKFLRRNKLAVIASAVVLLTLVAGIITTTLEARAARAHRARAERRFNEVRNIANSFMFEIHNSIKDLPGSLAARQLIMQRALEYLDSLAHDAGNDLSLTSELALAYEKIGHVTFNVQQAIASHRRATSLNETLVQAAPKNTAYKKQLSASYDNLSDVMKISGNSAEAIKYAKQAVAAIEPVATEQASDLETQLALVDRYISLGIALSDAGHFKEALDVDLAGMSIQKRLSAGHPSDMEVRRNLAEFCAAVSDAYENLGDYANALKFSHDETKISSEIFQSDPSSARSRRDMWSGYFRTGRQLAETGDVSGALENDAKATELIEALAAADPNDIGHQRWVALTYFSNANAFALAHQSDKAREHYDKAIAIDENLLGADTDRVEVRRDLSRIHWASGQLLCKRGQMNGGVEELTKAAALAQTSAEQDPENLLVRSRLAGICSDLGGNYHKLARLQDSSPSMSQTNQRKACDWYHRSSHLWQELKAKSALREIDADKIAEVEREIANCDLRMN